MDTEQLLQAVQEHFNDAKPFIPMYIHLIISALFPIYAGAHASLSRPSSAAKPLKKEKKAAETDDDEEEDVVQKMEGLSPQDAIVFPVTAGIVLAGLYFLIKRYGADLINLILGWYFSGVGVYSVAKLVNDGVILALSFLLPTYFARNGKLWKVDGAAHRAVALKDGKETAETAPTPLAVDLPKAFYDAIWTIRSAIKQRYATKLYIHDFIDFKGNLTIINFLSAVLGVVAISYANLVAKPWYLTNLQGFAVCYSAMQFMSPTTFATGSLILTGLFFYDIWAVFFTPLMVTVAKNLDQPIKLVFPRPEEPSKVPGEPPVQGYSMLGLGDIVLPGIMIGLALRFDLYMFYMRKQKKSTSTSSSGDGKQQAHVEKAPYVAVTSNYGERFWTWSLPASARPEKLNASFPKPYFYASMVGYVVGMLATLGVMSVFQHAQPALLYLVPGVLLSLWGTALVRGELKQMWGFSEAITGEQLDDDEENSNDKKEETKDVVDGRSLWQKLWAEIVGSSEDDAGKKDQAKDDQKTSGAAQDSQTKSEKKDDQTNDTIIAISVTRCRPTDSAEGEKVEDQSEHAGEDARPLGKTSSESSMEDTVLVD